MDLCRQPLGTTSKIATCRLALLTQRLRGYECNRLLTTVDINFRWSVTREQSSPRGRLVVTKPDCSSSEMWSNSWQQATTLTCPAAEQRQETARRSQLAPRLCL